MPKITRLLASSAFAAILLLTAGLGSTLAAGRTTEVYDLDDAWCFQDGVELACTVREGTLTIVTKADGTSIGTVKLRQDTTITVDGAFVAEYTTRTHDRTRSEPDGSYTTTTRERTRWTDGEETCVSRVILKIVDFDVVIDIERTACR